jgi:hypothetical protein
MFVEAPVLVRAIMLMIFQTSFSYYNVTRAVLAPLRRVWVTRVSAFSSFITPSRAMLLRRGRPSVYRPYGFRVVIWFGPAGRLPLLLADDPSAFRPVSHVALRPIAKIGFIFSE